MNDLKIAFELATIEVPIGNILPVRTFKTPEKAVRRYGSILSSIKHQGLIEPLVVHPRKGAADSYILVDGHLRYAVLKELGWEKATCIVSKDDECFTYNARINRLAPIQEHKMIMKAIDSGVSAESIAAALDLKLEYVRASMNLLDGLHEEAVEILKDRLLSPKTLSVLKKVSGVRQIEIAELMTSANNFSAWYAEALLISTPKEEFKNAAKPRLRKKIAPEDVAKMEIEMETLQRDLKAVEDSYGENNICLTVIRGYCRKLLENPRVTRFLKTRYPDYFGEFESFAAVETL